MGKSNFTFHSVDEAASARVACWLAATLDAPCLIFLHGDLGVGKTAFARGFIRARCGQATHVPSPSFALVQPYEAALPIWHADLYRLTDPSELEELGLTEAFEEAICLIEWPDRLGSLRPATSLTLRLDLTAQEGERVLHMSGPERWSFLKELSFT